MDGKSQCIRAISLQPVRLDSLYRGQLGFRDACLTFAKVSEAQDHIVSRRFARPKRVDLRSLSANFGEVAQRNA